MLMPSDAVRVRVNTARISDGPPLRTSASWSRYSGRSRCSMPGIDDGELERVRGRSAGPTWLVTTCSVSLIARPAEPSSPAPTPPTTAATTAGAQRWSTAVSTIHLRRDALHGAGERR